jgi:hypothetical protein
VRRLGRSTAKSRSDPRHFSIPKMAAPAACPHARASSPL